MSDYSINATIGADDSGFEQVVSKVIGGLGDISDSFGKMSDDNKASFADLANQFQAIDAKAQIWGDGTDTVAEKQNALKNAINKLIDDGITPESQQIQDLKSAYDTLGETQDESGEKNKTLGETFASLRDFMQGPVAACKLIVDGVKSVIENMGELSNEFAEDETAQLKFTAAIEASSVMTDGAAERLNTLAEALASSTGMANSAAQSQIAMLAATGRSEEQINNMITAAKGLAVATGVDLDTALNQINQTFSGTTGRLAKTTPALATLSEEELKNGDAVGILIAKYGEMGDALDNSSEVSIKNNANAWGEVKSAIGSLIEESMKPLRDSMTEAYLGFAKWATTGDNLKDTLSLIGPIIAGIAGAVLAYNIVVNAGAIATGLMTAATKLMNVVMATNPFGAIAAIVTAVLIPAIILLVKNWDTVSAVIKETCATLKANFEILGSKIAEVFTVAFSSVKIAALSLAQIIIDKVLGAISSLLKTVSSIPIIGDAFKGASDKVDGFKNSIDSSIQSAKDDSKQAIATAKVAQDSAQERLKAELARIKEETATRKAATDEDIADTQKTTLAATDAGKEKVDIASDVAKDQIKQNDKILKDHIATNNEEIKSSKEYTATEIMILEEELKANEKAHDAFIKLAEDRAKFETEWAVSASDNKQVQLDIEEDAALAQAAALGVSAETVANIKKYYDDQSTAYSIAKMDEIAGYATTISTAIGGTGTAMFNQFVTTGTAIATAAAEGFTNIGANISAVAELISLAGEANKEKYAELQEKFSELASTLLDALEPILSVVLDVLIAFMPVITKVVKILGIVIDFISPILDLVGEVIDILTGALSAAIDWVIDGIIEFLKFVNSIAKWLGVSTSALSGAIDELRSFGDTATDAGEETETFAGSLATAKTNAKKLSTQLDALNDTTLSFYESLANVGDDIAGKLVSNLTEGLTKSDFMTTMKSYITNLVVQAAVYTDALKSKMAAIGAAIAAGITSGFSSTSLSSIKKELESLYTSASAAASVATTLVSSAFSGYATGTDYSTAGWHTVGETGPENVFLPQGSVVQNAAETRSSGGSSSSTVVNATFNSPKALNQYEQMRALKKYNRELAFKGVI